MRWRFEGALLLAVLLAGCAEFPDSAPFAMASATPEPAIVQAAYEPAAPPPPGKFGVQIAAPRSVEEARALIDTIRARYPGELAQQWAMISRVELPNGVFYRVLIGPLGSEQQATQLCGRLRAQGAECFIRGT